MRPVGCAYLEPGAIVYLFEKKNGKGLAFVMGPNEKDEGTIELPVGDVTRVTLTDFCGNESVLPAAGGKVTVGANPMPVIVEDFELTLDPVRQVGSLSISVERDVGELLRVRLTDAGWHAWSDNRKARR